MRNLAAKSVIGAACGMSALASAARATVIAYEPFNYPAGSIAGATGGGSTGWAGAWALSSGSVTTGGPSTMLPVPSGTAAVSSFFATVGTPSSGQGIAQRFFASTITSASLAAQGSDILYFSYLVKRNDAGLDVQDLVLNGSVNGTAGNIAGFGVNNSTLSPTTNSNWGILNQQNTASWAPTAISSVSSPEVFLVGSVDFTTGAIDLWVNPQGTAQPPTSGSNFVSTTIALTTGITISNIIPFGSAAAASSTDYGAFTFGSSYADVVPEPSSLALVCLPAVALLRRRRVRHSENKGKTCSIVQLLHTEELTAAD
jgi:hypothetical protein